MFRRFLLESIKYNSNHWDLLHCTLGIHFLYRYLFEFFSVSSALVCDLDQDTKTDLTVSINELPSA